MSLIRNALAEVARRAAERIETPAKPTDEQLVELDDLREQCMALQRELVELRRIRTEYREAIERGCAESKRWKELYFTQSREHQTAQSMLERTISSLGRRLSLAVRYVAQQDESAAKQLQAKLDAEVNSALGTAAAYGERMAELSAEAAAEGHVDAATEQARIEPAAKDPAP